MLSLGFLEPSCCTIDVQVVLASLHIIYLQHFIPVVVDDLHRDLAGLRGSEGSARGVVERGPGLRVDLGFQGFLQAIVRLIVRLIGTLRPEVWW